MARNSLGVEVKGGRELAKGTARLFVQLEAGAETAFLGVAAKESASLRVRVPRRSGALAADVIAGRDEGAAIVGYGGGVPYAAYIEFGGFHGRPYVREGRYLYPSALDTEPQLLAAGTAAANRDVRGFRWPTPSR